MTEEFPAVELGYELRLTRRALQDLGVAATTPPGDLDAIEKSAADKAGLVEKFADLRSEVPTGTESPMRSVGRPDIYSLHGQHGVRACTWYDAENQVCWLLGCVDEHDYAEFETRAANGDLLPNIDDITILLAERSDFESSVRDGVRYLYSKARENPGVPLRGTVGDLLRLEVAVLVVPVADGELADLFIVVRLPPLPEGVDTPRGWPGRQRLAELALGVEFAGLDVAVPEAVPAATGMRKLDFGVEMAIRVENVFLPTSG